MSFSSLRTVVARAASLPTLVAVLLLSVAAGCNTEPQGPPSPPIDKSPQAQYQRVMEELYDKLGSRSESLRSDTGTGTAAYHYQIDAPDEVDVPESAAEPARVTIVITMTSSYSLLPRRDEESPATDKAGKSREDGPGREQMEAQLKEMGVEVLDPSRMQADLEEATRRRLQTPGLASRSFNARSSSTYELIFDRGRWRYARPPAADAMGAATRVVEGALDKQF